VRRRECAGERNEESACGVRGSEGRWKKGRRAGES